MTELMSSGRESPLFEAEPPLEWRRDGDAERQQLARFLSVADRQHATHSGPSTMCEVNGCFCL
jgi:hypothetical protein